MKILYIANIMNRVNNFCMSSMYAALELGFEFHIAANLGYKNDEEIRLDEAKYGIKIHQIDFIRQPYDLKNIVAYRQTVELIQKENFDVIHCNTPIGGVIGRLAGKKCNVNKIIYQAHGFHFYQGAPILNWLIYYPIEKIFARFTDALTTINFEDYEFAKKRFHLRDNGKIYYVPGVGIDLTLFGDLDKKNRLVKKSDLGLSDDCKIVISVGELNKNKNHQVIIKALGRLKNQNIHYILCGQGNEELLSQIALEEGISKQVHFLGYRTDVAELLKLSDIYVMPSIREGLSRSIMEAMACGMPCVVSDIRGNRDLIENGKSGYLCPFNDEQAFAESIEEIIDSGKKDEMGHYARKMVEKFEINIVIEEIKKIYVSVINERK